MATQQLFSVSQAAEKLGVTDGRVRQICREYSIGIFMGRDRFLSQKEIEKIQNLPDRRKKVAG